MTTDEAVTASRHRYRRGPCVLTIFFFALLPQFVPSTDQISWLEMMGLSAVFMAGTFFVFALYGVFAAGMRAEVLTRPAVVAWLDRGPLAPKPKSV